MSLKWLTVNARLTKGITIINSLPTKKFHLLLTHIVTSNSEEIFTSEELMKLKDSFKLNDEDLILLIQSIKYIVKQSARVILKPTTLEQQLKENLKLDEAKSEIFTKVWSEEIKKDLGDFSELMKLDDLAWEQNIKIADQISFKEEVPIVRLQLKLSSTNGHKNNEKITIDMDKEELTQFYNTLEAIQMKLDHFSN